MCKSVHYSVDKYAGMQIREVTDKKIFESMTAFYDLKAIKLHRKLCLATKSYSKARKTFIESVEKAGEE